MSSRTHFPDNDFRNICRNGWSQAPIGGLRRVLVYDASMPLFKLAWAYHSRLCTSTEVTLADRQNGQSSFTKCLVHIASRANHIPARFDSWYHPHFIDGTGDPGAYVLMTCMDEMTFYVQSSRYDTETWRVVDDEHRHFVMRFLPERIPIKDNLLVTEQPQHSYDGLRGHWVILN